MSDSLDHDLSGNVGRGPACSRCGEPLVLFVEPGILEFCCPDDHSFQVQDFVAAEADRARRLIQRALAYWEKRQQELSRPFESAEAEGGEPFNGLGRRRLLAATERVNTLRQNLARLA